MTTADVCAPPGDGLSGFVMVDLSLLRRFSEAGLPPRALEVFLWLKAHRNQKTGLCCPSVDRLAKLVGVCVRTVKESIGGLLHAGFLAVERFRRKSGKLGVNHYAIVGEVPEFGLPAPGAPLKINHEDKNMAQGDGSRLAKVFGARRKAQERHDVASAKREEKISKPKFTLIKTPVAEEEVPAAMELAESGKGHAGIGEVRKWFEEARDDFWPGLAFVPPWTGREFANTKRLAEVYKADMLRSMVRHLWRNRARYGLDGVPTPSLLWAMQARVLGEIQTLLEGKPLASEKHVGKNGDMNAPHQDRHARLTRDEWDESQSLTGPEGGSVDIVALLSGSGG